MAAEPPRSDHPPNQHFECASQALEPILPIFFQCSGLISAMIMRICESANFEIISLRKEDRGRLQFLNDTISLTNEFLGESCRQNETIVQFHAFRVLLTILNTRMEDVFSMLSRIESCESAMTANFDVFELKLRNYLSEMRTLFPLNVRLGRPADVIADTDARAMWTTHFGDVYFVEFKNFLNVLTEGGVLRKNSPSYERQVSHLRYFLNFPSDEVVTPYKWALLIRLFGPYQCFAMNFSAIMNGQGFLGLINRIQACEILTLSPLLKTFLIRLSRTEPEFLAFSYKNSQGRIGHQINKDPETGLPIPIAQYIAEKFKDYQVVNQKLNVDKILENRSTNPLSDYAVNPDGYYD